MPIEIHPKTGCWVWLGKLSDRGYGLVRISHGGEKKAHILMWEMWKGAVRERHELHHKCENRQCCNPEHLVMVTRREHMTLHPGWDGWHAVKERCGRGHEFTPENTYVRKNGARMCRECMKLRVANWRRKNRPPGGGPGLMEPEYIEVEM